MLDGLGWTSMADWPGKGNMKSWISYNNPSEFKGIKALTVPVFPPWPSILNRKLIVYLNLVKSFSRVVLLRTYVDRKVAIGK